MRRRPVPARRPPIGEQQHCGADRAQAGAAQRGEVGGDLATQEGEGGAVVGGGPGSGDVRRTRQLGGGGEGYLDAGFGVEGDDREAAAGSEPRVLTGGVAEAGELSASGGGRVPTH